MKFLRRLFKKNTPVVTQPSIQPNIDKQRIEANTISIQLPVVDKFIEEAINWYEELCRSRNERISKNPSAVKSRAIFLCQSQYERVFDQIRRSGYSSCTKHRIQVQVSKEFKSDLDKIVRYFDKFPNELESANISRMNLPCLGTCRTHYGLAIEPDILHHYIDTLKSNPKLEASFDWGNLERLIEERLICSQSYHILMSYLNDSTFNFAKHQDIVKDSIRTVIEQEPLCWLCNIIYKPLLDN